MFIPSRCLASEAGVEGGGQGGVVVVAALKGRVVVVVVVLRGVRVVVLRAGVVKLDGEWVGRVELVGCGAVRRGERRRMRREVGRDMIVWVVLSAKKS